MFYLILVLLILDALLLATVVLLQSGEGGGLASLGGGMTDRVVGGRQAVTLLTRMSWWCGGIFLGLSLILSVMAAGGAGGPSRSNLQEQIRQSAPPAAAPSQLPIENSAPVPPGGAPSPTPAQ
ncbi:MAG TPA: preprotein translocase subunit SecG [Gemmatimonadales bacterium]|nr:preprotein translocase subunit SecG [Gemmatimonadales bacterium]